MKTIHQIKDEVVQDYGWESWEEIYDADGVTNHIIEVIAERTAREALKNAAENAKTEQGYCSDAWTPSVRIVDKQSILDESNIPKL